MARIDLPQSKVRLRRRRRRVRIALVALAAVVVVVGGMVALSRATFLRVTAVVVSGTQTVSAGEVTSLVEDEMSGSYYYMFARDDIFLYPKHAIMRALLAAYPAFKTVDVHAADFHTVAVQVTERQPAALYCSDTCFLMDEDGVIYAPAPAATSTYVMYSGTALDPSQATLPKQFLSSDQFHSLAALAQALSQIQATTTVESVGVGDSGDVDATFTDGFVLKFSLNDASGDIFERFMLALKADPFSSHSLSDFEYLDLRFGDKLYYMLKTK